MDEYIPRKKLSRKEMKQNFEPWMDNTWNEEIHEKDGQTLETIH